MAADHMAVDEKKGEVGGAMDFKNMDLGELMKDFDPAMLQELLAEEMKDPALQEMVSAKRYLWMDSLSFRKLRLSYALVVYIVVLVVVKIKRHIFVMTST